MAFLTEYGLFLAKVATLLLAALLLVGIISGLRRHDKDEGGKLKLTSLNAHYEDLREQLLGNLLNKKARKAHEKARKKAEKEKNTQEQDKPRLFVLDFDGDIDAAATGALRGHISTLLQVAQEKDTVLLRLESHGGFVHSYGLAASQLARLRSKALHLVVSVDKVAASGGYMMACVGNEIIAAPFAVLGSVGVIGSLPNFHTLLEKHDIHYEQHTAGEHKRSLTMFGENTDADRAQFKKELAETHELFKQHIAQMRPQLDVAAVATGETWYGTQALEKGLIDRIETSDDFLLQRLESHQILQLAEEKHEPLLERLKSRFLGRTTLQLPFKARLH